VHLPHGYDGISPVRAKAVRNLPGPVYVHCHHEKHRSPAAAAVACIRARLLNSQQGSQVLQVAGTNHNYKGLFESVERTRAIEKTVLDVLSDEFPSTAKLPANLVSFI
jgi:hypothetical protein